MDERNGTRLAPCFAPCRPALAARHEGGTSDERMGAASGSWSGVPGPLPDREHLLACRPSGLEAAPGGQHRRLAAAEGRRRDGELAHGGDARCAPGASRRMTRTGRSRWRARPTITNETEAP